METTEPFKQTFRSKECVKQTRAVLSLSRLYTVLMLALSLTPARAHASSDIQSMLTGGISLFNQANSVLVGQTGLVGNFQVQMRDRWLRPTFGAMVELNQGTNRLWGGHAQLGMELVAYKARYVKPLIAVMGDFGWASYTTGAANYVGIVYGVVITAGAEFRFSKKDSALGLRLCTSWRFLMGTIGGGLSGSDLNSMLITGGLVF